MGWFCCGGLPAGRDRDCGREGKDTAWQQGGGEDFSFEQACPAKEPGLSDVLVVFAAFLVMMVMLFCVGWYWKRAEGPVMKKAAAAGKRKGKTSKRKSM